MSYTEGVVHIGHYQQWRNMIEWKGSTYYSDDRIPKGEFTFVISGMDRSGSIYKEGYGGVAGVQRTLKDSDQDLSQL